MHENLVGVIYSLSELLGHGPGKLFDLGIGCVQLLSGDTSLYTEENAKAAKDMLAGKIKISSFWAGWSGPAVWDSIDGPHTLGLVPPAFRAKRLDEVLKGATFAYMLGAANVATHVGFIPEHPSFPEYRGIVQTIKYIASHCAALGICFNFETGQETPTTLMRCINDIGLENVGINFDPANLILYGRGNPVDAIDIFGGRIKGVHVKDGDYPSGDFYRLGNERKVGEGTVNFPVFLPKLLERGYRGDLYIEREISGEQQIKDIKDTIAYVKNILNA